MASTAEGLQTATEGYGPLLQRDYWAVIAGCRLRPSELIDLVALEFARFAPIELCQFELVCREKRAFRLDDVLDIRIRMAGHSQVRVLNRESNSVTLGTLEGHPEAGRITFGAYRSGRGDVIFHIRSRARASTPGNYLGFLALGESMQTNTWADFVNAVALSAGDGVAGALHVETREIEDEPADALAKPTFVAVGD